MENNHNTKIYTGIGSREITQEGIDDIYKVAGFLRNAGYLLRSGGADGADTAFETGHSGMSQEIYLPWKNFNKNKSPLFTQPLAAKEMAIKYHPMGVKLNEHPAILKLMARNCQQVLGQNLDIPTDFIVCWTHDEYKGGTSQALRIARDLKIPYFNLKDLKQKEALFNKLGLWIYL